MPARRASGGCARCKHPKSKHTHKGNGQCAVTVYVPRLRRKMPCDCPRYAEPAVARG